MERLTLEDIKQLKEIKKDFLLYAPPVPENLNTILGIFTDKHGMIKTFGIRFYKIAPQINEVINDNLLFIPYENLSIENREVTK